MDVCDKVTFSLVVHLKIVKLSYLKHTAMTMRSCVYTGK